MKKIAFQIDELKFINEFFDGEMCLCGGMADFIHTGYSEIADIDLLIKSSAFIRSMNIVSIEESSVIKKYNFNIERIFHSFLPDLTPHEYFYAGLYNKIYPIDIFIVDNLNDTVFLPQHNIKKYGINIVSPHDRIDKCQKTLLAKEDNASKSSLEWLRNKKQKSRDKLKLYKKKYPEIIFS